MKLNKFVLTLISIFGILTTPTQALAVIQNLNGATGQNQTFQSDSNVTMTRSGDTHILGWLNFLPVSRGGTGAGSFTSGSVLFSNGTTFAQDNSNLFWDDTNNRLGLGTTSPSTTLDIVGSTKISGNLTLGSGENSGISRFVAIGIPNTATLEGGFSAGTTDNSSLVRGVEMNWQNETDPANSFGYVDTFGYENDLWLNGKNVRIQNDSAGNVGIGSVINPNAKLDVAGTIRGESTFFLGTSIIPGCIAMADSDGSGITYVTANDGVLTASSTKPSFCQ